jgi:hypothetical protein
VRSLTSFPPEPEYSAVTTLSRRETSNSLEKSSSALKFADRIEYKGRSKEEVDVLTSMTGEGSWIKENYEDGWKRGTGERIR